ncbi:PREDICTED: thioredoxin H9-like [Ipomoea nil]|uniref:thioredoxin H9-like n=1 Tax=Ipomoea nil TaxID=35883 RepID=UPI000900B836|nr:PREDICTED: thioredoxin H9-like [Ipomoea nil]
MTMGNFIPKVCIPKFLLKNVVGDGDGDDDESWHTVDYSGKNVHLITTEESWEEKMEEANKDDKIAIVNFSASWCSPCRTIAPLFSELSMKHLSWMFLVVDVDVLSDLSTTWDIKATPTFFFLRGGKQFEKVIGANKEELQKKVTEVVDSETSS